jgi:hypothetical protein
MTKEAIADIPRVIAPSTTFQLRLVLVELPEAVGVVRDELA